MTVAEVADAIQAAAAALIVLGAGYWSIRRYRFPETDSPGLSLTIPWAVWSPTGDRILLAFRLSNDHRVAIRTGPFAVHIGPVGDAPFGQEGADQWRFESAWAPGSEDILRFSRMVQHPRGNFERHVYVPAQDLRHLYVVVVFEFIEWKRWWRPGRSRRPNFAQATVVDVPEHATRRMRRSEEA